MLHPLLALLTAGLFAINQYIPLNHGEYVRYVYDINDWKKEDIFPAANQSCQYLISGFISVGLEQVLGNIAGQSFGNLLKEELNKEDFLDKTLNSLLSDPYSQSLEQYGLEAQTTISFIKKLCDKNFSPLSFSPQESQALFDFIQSEVHILNPQDFKKNPRRAFFGSVPLIDRNNQSLGSLYTNSKKWVNYNEMSPHLILALISAEDQNFFLHEGVDTSAVSRLAKQLMANGSQRTAGGSTLTMQLLKNFYFQSASSNIEFLNQGRASALLRKVREWYWAKEFERSFQSADKISGKKKILEHYFNLFDFGHQIQGIHQASEIYFSKKTKDLSLAESAFISTLFKGPYIYSKPENYSKHTKARRDNYVLNQVAKFCSHSLGSASLYNTEIQKIFKELCKEGKQPIDISYIEKQKTKALPIWSPPKNRIEEFLIPIHKQAKLWLNQIPFQDSFTVKELKIKSSIDKNLQKILFETTREYLDEEDQKRNILSEIQPARNDKGEKAQITKEHLPRGFKQKLDKLIQPGQTKDTQYTYSIRLSPHPDSNSLDSRFIRNFLREDFSSSRIDQIIEEIKSNLLESHSGTGALTFIKLTKTKISLMKLKAVLKELSLSADHPINQDIARLKDTLFKNALSQLFQNRSREYLEPALYLSEGLLIDKNLKPVNLAESSKQHLLQSAVYQPGDFFWIKVSDQGYSLQREKLQSAIVILDSHSGEILARFDGYNPKNSFFYRASQSQRQPGSTVKAFTYLYALDRKSFYPQSLLNNRYAVIPVSKTEVYEPKNFSKQIGSPLALFKAFIHSQNIATINLIKHPIWGASWKSNLNELNHFFADINLYPYKDISNTLYPSVILGSKEISVTKLTSAFSLFANGRFIAKPYLFKKVSNYQDQELYYVTNTMIPHNLQKAYSLFQMQSLLVASSNIGTSARLNSFVSLLEKGKYRHLCYNDLLSSNHQSCFGGKTGTSNNSKDLWFIGFSKNFLIGIWIGYDAPESLNALSSRTTLPLFEKIVQKSLKYLPPLEPIVSPDDKPPFLEKRAVSGNQACSNTDIENPDWIYVEKASPHNQCHVVIDKKCSCETAAFREKNSAGQVIKETPGYTLDIFYNNRLYENNGFYNSLQECEEAKKHYISSKTQEPVCPL